jgi:hypothetical protein
MRVVHYRREGLSIPPSGIRHRCLTTQNHAHLTILAFRNGILSSFSVDGRLQGARAVGAHGSIMHNP